MVGVCCGCVAKPASVQPRKTYNTLVPQLFAGEPAATDEAIDSSTRRKIQKLQEYVQANPAKIPKVSRRLMRRIAATLLNPGANLGHVKVAVHAYIYMLARSTDDVSSYSPGFFAQEVVLGPDSVVPLLLKDVHIEMRTLGAELLAVFTRVQSHVDCHLNAIQVHVPQVCRAAQAALSAGRKEQRLQEAAGRRQQGGKLVVPNPLDLVARRDPAHVAALEVACLRCLGELVALCSRSRVLPQHLSDILAVMLDILRVFDRGLGAGSEALQEPGMLATPAAPSAAGACLTAAAGSACGAVTGPATGPSTACGVASGPSVVDVAFYEAMGIQGVVPPGSQPRQLAAQLLSLVGAFMCDIATVHSILDAFYEYLDEHGRWQEPDIVKDLLAVLSASGSQHQFPMYASLLRHASSRRLALQDCAVVLGLAATKGATLDEAYSLAALALALHEVPRAWAQQARHSPRALPLQAFFDLLRVGPARGAHAQPAVGPRGAPAHAAAGPAASASPSTLAAQTSHASPGAGPAAAAAAGAGDGAEKGNAAAYKQQLAQLKEAMLGAVRLLSGGVSTAAELSEAVAGALAAAAAELGLAGPGAAGSAAGGGRAGAAGPFAGLLALAGSGAGQAAAAGSAGSGSTAAEAAAAKQAAGASEAAAAVMMLQCAAAATEAFVEQCSCSSQGRQMLVLPGGALPAVLVSSAVRLLSAAAPALVRRPVQRVLLALLPAAGKGVPSDKLSRQLAEATLLEMPHLLHSDRSSAAAQLTGDVRQPEEGVAAMDALLRACLAGPQARPNAALLVARMLLQQQALWVERGYRAAGSGSSARCARAALLLANSQMAALAEATGSQELQSQQLPLDPSGCSALRLSSRGMQATGVPGDDAASAAAVAALQQERPPTVQQGQALRLALGRAPLLVAEYGERLQQLLDEQRSTHQSTASSEAGRGGKPQLGEKVHALLATRMNSLRRDVVHVSELMRDSISRVHDTTPASKPGMPHARLSPSAVEVPGAAGSSSGTDGALPPASTAAVDLSGGASSSGQFAETGGAALAAAKLLSPAAACEALTGVHGIAGLAERGASANGSRVVAPQQQQRVADPDGVELQMVEQQPGSKQCGKVSAVVSHALQQPIPAGAYVVKDVKISRLAGELEM